MIIDRILKDILGFIRRLLLWRSNKKRRVYKKPFRSMRQASGLNSLITLIEGRDTPRAVRTWVYSLKRHDLNSTKAIATQALDDLHLYLDFLGPLPSVSPPNARPDHQDRQGKRCRGERASTHRVLILQSSHFLNSDGFYDYKMVFWQDYDFYVPMGVAPDKLAVLVMDKLAYWCLSLPNAFDLTYEDWEEAIHAIWQEIRGRVYA